MNLLVLHPHDNVAIALSAIAPGETGVTHDGESIVVVSDVPVSHKVARVDIPAGSPVVKYGEVIAVAQVDIGRGDWVHRHNLENHTDRSEERQR